MWKERQEAVVSRQNESAGKRQLPGWSILQVQRFMPAL